MNFIQPQEILVVDDDRKIVNLVSMYLQNAYSGLTVRLAPAYARHWSYMG